MNYKSGNTFIRILYSPGFSSIKLSFFKVNLTFSFNPYMGKDHRGLDQYDLKTFCSMSVNYEGAAFFYLAAMPILTGKDTESHVEATLINSNNNATLRFEYKPDQNNQMTAWFVINKDNQMIPFKFKTHEYTVKENGQMVTKTAQSGLGAFVKTLEGYLLTTGGANHLSKLTDDVLYPEGIPPLPTEDD